MESKVVCPVCRESQVTRNVRTLPLDGPALKHIYEHGGAEMMAYCSRCHDETESFSWCFDCQSALCEFHHKDHTMSVDTIEHRVESFKSIADQNLSIDPHLPPISCPESLVADCTAWCKTHQHLISADAMVKGHLHCDVVAAKDLYESARGDILVAAANVLDREEEVQGAMDHLRQVMLQLDEETEAVAASIDDEFLALKKMVEERERTLHGRLEDIAARKRNALAAQLNTLSAALESCKQASSVATSVVDAESTAPPDADGMYVVSASRAIIDRCDRINNETLALPLSPCADPMVRLTVDRREVRVVETLVKAVGALQTLDSLPSLDRAALQASAKLEGSDDESSKMPVTIGDHNKYMSESSVVNNPTSSPTRPHGMAHMAKTVTAGNAPPSPPKPPPVDIHFTVKADPSSQLSDMRDGTRSLETITIEARLTPKPALDEEGKESDEKKQDKPRLPGDDWSEALGDVLGQIVLKTEVDRRFFPRHEVRNLLESLHSGNLPTFRVVKEVTVLNA